MDGKATITVGKDTGEFALGARTFSTGSRGFHGTGKMHINGKKHQVNLLIVEIGSKPVSAPKKV